MEEKQKEEKELLKKEKQQLFVDRREKQVKMKLLENKIELVQLVSKNTVSLVVLINHSLFVFVKLLRMNQTSTKSL